MMQCPVCNTASIHTTIGDVCLTCEKVVYRPAQVPTEVAPHGAHRVLKWATALSLVLVFVATNALVAGYYRSHLYPNAHIAGVAVGGLSKQRAAERLGRELTHRSITLALADHSLSYKASELGLTWQTNTMVETELARQDRSRVPVSGLVRSVIVHNDPGPIYATSSQYEESVRTIISSNSHSPTDAAVVINGAEVNILEDKSGETYDADKIRDALRQSAATGKPAAIKPQVVPPKRTAKGVEPIAAKARAKLAQKITLHYKGVNYTASPEQIASWIQVAPDVTDISVNQAAVAAYVASLAAKHDIAQTPKRITTLDGNVTGTTAGKDGLAVRQDAAVQVVSDALTSGSNVDYELQDYVVVATTNYIKTYTPKPAPTRGAGSLSYTYCVAARSVSTAYLDEFAAKAASVYADGRGWSLGGKISFTRVASGCNYTLWLAAANTLPMFSSACSAQYSCRVGSNVIINFDRWSSSSAAWVGGGGSVDDYRTEVINHETGHWLGFDHWHCSGPGQPAPVMQQQSISLEGCRINWWPLPGEIGQLQRMKRI